MYLVAYLRSTFRADYVLLVTRVYWRSADLEANWTFQVALFGLDFLVDVQEESLSVQHYIVNRARYIIFSF